MDKFYKQLDKLKPYEVEESKRILKFNKPKMLMFYKNYKYDFVTFPKKNKILSKNRCSKFKTDNFLNEFNGFGKLSGIATTKRNHY